MTPFKIIIISLLLISIALQIATYTWLLKDSEMDESTDNTIMRSLIELDRKLDTAQ